jgi:shikimate dehydrogenase
MIISGHAELFWILGHPVRQTVSPGLFNAAFSAAKMNAALVPLDVAPAQLPQALEMLRCTGNLRGSLLTIPHKIPAVEHMDVLSERSQALGLVNIIRKTDRGLEGDALDGQGFLGALKRHGQSVVNQSVLVIGCGGAGAACAWDALEAGAAYVGIFDVNENRLSDVKSILSHRFDSQRVRVLRSIHRHMSEWGIVLNTSPIGMQTTDPMPIELDLLSSHTVLVDAITPQYPSRWLTQAAARGHSVIHGIEFTRGQVLSMAHYFGLPMQVIQVLSES